MDYQWWPGQPVLEAQVSGDIANREEAHALSVELVRVIEAESFAHVIVILDLTALRKSPSAGVLLSGSLPETYKIEHLIMINAPSMLRMATMPLFHLRNKLHFVDSNGAAQTKAEKLLPQLKR